MDVGFHQADALDVDLVPEHALDIHRGGKRTDACQVDALERSHIGHLHIGDLHGEVREALEDGDIPFTPVHHGVQVLVDLVLHRRLDLVLEHDRQDDGRRKNKHDEDAEREQDAFGPLGHGE